MSNFEFIRDRLAELNPDALLADGFEDALIGYGQRFCSTGHILVALYDRTACIRILVERDGMSWEGAEECFECNTAGAYVGEHTPAFATIGPE